MCDLKMFRHLALALTILGASMLPMGAAYAQQGAQAQRPQALAQVLPVPARETPATFSTLATRLMPSVVNISTSQRVAEAGLPEFPQGSPLERFNDFFGRDDDGFRRASSLGSGFVIDAKGVIVTNNHVIENADEIEVTFPDGTSYTATLIGRDPDTDIALLRIDPAEPLPAVKFGNSDTALVGDWVIAIGNPFGFGGSVSAGIVSARNRDINAGNYDEFIQTDAAINSGNSGGPLFNLKGEVVGVNTAIISPTGGSVGIGFSVPSNVVRSVVNQIVREGRVRRGWLGVNIQPTDRDIAATFGLKSASGVIVTRVEDESPASKAGLSVGDLILTFNGTAVDDTRELSRKVAQTKTGSAVPVTLIRDRKRQTVQVTLTERASDGDDADDDDRNQSQPLFVSANRFGMKLSEVNEDARRRYGVVRSVRGALVDLVDPDGSAHGRVRKGDVIVEIDFRKVNSVDEAERALDSLDSDKPVLLKLHRRGQVSFAALPAED